MAVILLELVWRDCNDIVYATPAPCDELQKTGCEARKGGCRMSA
jgi:hypothetical protein